MQPLSLLLLLFLSLSALFAILQSEALPRRTFNSLKPSVFSDSDLPNCNKTVSCAGLGDDCDSDYFTGCNKTGNGRCCAQPLYCLNKVNGTGTCQTDNFGSSCKSNLDCRANAAGTTLSSCVNSTCIQIYNVGDSCDNDDECLTQHCQDGLCQGSQIGQSCSPILSLLGPTCVPGAYCNTLGICIAAGTDGAICLDSSTCAPNYTCVLGKCSPLFSLPEGSYCTGLSNLECKTNEACVNNKCLVGKDSSISSCDSDSDCDSNHCLCATARGEGVCSISQTATNCNTEFSDLYSCLTQHNCSYSTSSSPPYYGPNSAPNSCTMKHCKTQLIATDICECALIKPVLGGCYYEYYCSKLPLWLLIVLIVACVVLLLLCCLCTFICVRCCRRRRGYHAL